MGVSPDSGMSRGSGVAPDAGVGSAGVTKQSIETGPTITAGTDPTYTASKVFSVSVSGTEVYRVQQNNYAGSVHDHTVSIKPTTGQGVGHAHGNQNYNVSPWFAPCALGSGYADAAGTGVLGRMHNPVDGNIAGPFAWAHYAASVL